MNNEFSDEELEFRVLPYQFEPTQSNSQREDAEESDLTTSDEENDGRPVDEWCCCGHCVTMPTEQECRCCRNFLLCTEKMEPSNLKCVTQHDAFRANCLNRDVLELAFYDYLDLQGHTGDDEPVHELYRHIAYRRFARWYGIVLGEKIERSCHLV